MKAESGREEAAGQLAYSRTPADTVIALEALMSQLTQLASGLEAPGGMYSSAEER